MFFYIYDSNKNNRLSHEKTSQLWFGTPPAAASLHVLTFLDDVVFSYYFMDTKAHSRSDTATASRAGSRPCCVILVHGVVRRAPMRLNESFVQAVRAGGGVCDAPEPLCCFCNYKDDHSSLLHDHA